MIVFLLDQFSKYLAVSQLPLQIPVKINRFFNLYLDFNTGASFGFLSHQLGWQIWFFSIIAIIISLMIMIYFFKTPHLSSTHITGLAFILGGAVGNLTDRLLHQRVTDFFSWHINDYYFPTFNIADSAVFIGVLLLFAVQQNTPDKQDK